MCKRQHSQSVSCIHFIALWVVAGLLWLAVGTAGANYRFDRLELDDGLTQSKVFAVAEDSQGRMWIGTEGGLNHFDGYQIRPFVTDHKDGQELTSTRIMGLYAAKNGDLWAATARGVSRFDPTTGAVERFAHVEAKHNLDQQSPLSNFHRAQFMADCKDRLVIARNRYVYVLSPQGEQQLLVASIENGLPTEYRHYDLVKDFDGNVWIASASKLWRLDCQTGIKEEYLSRPVAQDHVAVGGVSVAMDALGVIHWPGPEGLWHMDTTSLMPLEKTNARELLDEGELIWAVDADSSGRVWVASSKGIGMLTGEHSPRAKTLQHRLFFSGQWENASRVDLVAVPFSVGVSGDGLVWTTSLFGVVAIDPATEQAQAMVHDPTRTDSFPPIRPTVDGSLYVDRFGVVWLSGGFKGISRYSPQSNRFAVVRNSDPYHSSARAMATVKADNQGYLWVGWDGGFVSFWKQGIGGNYTWINDIDMSGFEFSDPIDTTVRAMVNAKDGMVWMASSNALWRADYRSGSISLVHVFDRYMPSGIEGRQGIYSNINLFFDANSQQLFLSHARDIWRMPIDPQSNEITDFERLEWAGSGQDNLQVSMMALQDGRLLVGTLLGWRIIDWKTQQVIEQRLSDPIDNDPESFSISLAQSSNGEVWVGSRRGLRQYRFGEDGTTLDLVRLWNEENGLANSVIYGIAPTSDGPIWISHNRGVNRLDPNSGQVNHFTTLDGLPALEFNSRAVDQDQAGFIYFGGINGVVVLDPKKIKPQPDPPDVFLDEAWINQSPVGPQASRGPMEWQHDQNYLTIAYGGIHFSALGQNEYAYQLEGLESEWVMAGKQRVARYPALPSGQYRFWVRAANLDGVWSEPKLLLEATIRPPIWATTWAYVVYFTLGLMLVLLAFWLARQRRIQLESLVAKRTTQLDEKNRFIASQARKLEEALEARTLLFANISHEFRTPLTLIQAAIDQLDPEERQPKANQLARRYLQRLTRLVDQLLDLSRLRVTGVGRAPKPWSVSQIAQISAEGFSYLAKQRGITLHWSIEPNCHTDVDQASVEKIILNLLTNALKFTPSGGAVQIGLERKGEALVLSVKDTGPGIPADHQSLIFERFERLPAQEAVFTEGAGIGLALVREAANAIGGSVVLESEVGQGSCFRVRFPALAESVETKVGDATGYLSEQRMRLDRDLLEAFQAPAPDPAVEQQQSHDQQPSILIVEDNPDLRAHLATLLQTQWRVHQAADGLEAMELLAEEEIDVILSDIMMPKMDGLTLLEKVRTDLQTSHIPFMLLSARNDSDTRLQGLQLAADDFLAKPFAPQELVLKLQNMVRSRQRLQSMVLHRFGHQGLNSIPGKETANDMALSPRDHKFMDRLLNWVAKHHQDPDLTVGQMASQLAVNERTLQRKTRALTGLSPLHFLNHHRLEKAKELLADRSKTIQEVAFDTGFASATTFSRLFKKAFGSPPSQWRG